MKKAVSLVDALRVDTTTSLPAARVRPVPPTRVASDLLCRALARLDGTTDLAAAARVVDVCVPSLADSAAVHLLDGPVRGEDPATLAPGDRLLVRAVAARGGTGWGPTRALLADSPLREAMESRHLVHRELGGAVTSGGELVAVPLLSRGLPLGVLVLHREPGRPAWSAGDVAAIEQLAMLTALRLDVVRLQACRAATSAALQECLLPAMPRALTAVDVAARYRTAGPGDGVGGDWLSAIPLPGGRTAFAVGDVMGHGTRAAVLMGTLRAAIQALAPLHLDPAQVLRQLDDLAGQHQADRPDQENWLATCLYAVYDPVTGLCDLASAGHPPPVLTGADGTSRLLEPEPGMPLGVGAGRYRTSRVKVPPGSQLVLYTDGLVEVRGQDIEDGMAVLRGRASAGRNRPLDQLCQSLLDQAVRGDRPDDVALLVARFRGLPPDRVATWTFAADPGLAGHAGWLAGRALGRWGLHGAVRTVVPLVDEVVADIARHGAGPVTLRLVCGAALLCEIGDTAGHLPAGRRDDGGGRAGRGLARHPLDGGVDRWGAYRTATGKVVWFERSFR